MKRNNNTMQDNIDEANSTPSASNKISLNQYLSLYNRKNVLNKVIRTWFNRIDNTKPKKTKEEWDKVLNKFHTETE